MELQLLIIVAFAAGAGVFVIAASIGLLINKSVEQRSYKSRKRLYDRYVAICGRILLAASENPDFESNSAVRQAFYAEIIRPLQRALAQLSEKTRRRHREVVGQVLLDLAKDVSGEMLERLNYLFYELGIVDEEIRRLKDSRWWVRAGAARDLGLTRARRAMAPLSEILNDSQGDVRYEAMRALAASVGVEALRMILSCYEQLTQWNAIELSLIVMQFREKAVPYLVEALGSRSTAIVLFSIEMLAEIGFVSAVEPLRELARSYPNVLVRAKAMEALGRLGDGRAEPLLLKEINNPNPDLRLSAIQALGKIGTPAAVDPLLGRLPRSGIREQLLVVEALARSGAKGLKTVQELEVGEIPALQKIAAHVLEILAVHPSH